MKNLLTWAFFGLSLLVMSCQDVATNQIPALRSAQNPLGLYDVESSSVERQKMARQTIDSLRGLLADYQRIESEQNGVCDTCVTGFVSVLIEHRAVSKKLSDEIEEMNRNLRKVKVYNSEAVALIKSYQRQSGELEKLVANDKTSPPDPLSKREGGILPIFTRSLRR